MRLVELIVFANEGRGPFPSSLYSEPILEFRFVLSTITGKTHQIH